MDQRSLTGFVSFLLISVKDASGLPPEGAVVTGASAAHRGPAVRMISKQTQLNIKLFLIEMPPSAARAFCGLKNDTFIADTFAFHPAILFSYERSSSL
jgi:hypothetical protein